jgi:hypothetical protein
MKTPITLSLILQINEISIHVIYDLLVEGLDVERNKLRTNEASKNAAGYIQSLNRISQYHRLLSILRHDTLNTFAGWQQTGN